MFMEIGIRTLVFVNLFEEESQAINIKFYLLLPSKPGAKAKNKEEILSQSESFYCPLDHVFLFFLPLYILIWQIGIHVISCNSCRRCSAYSCFASWSGSMCWNNCNVCDLSHGHGSWQDHCAGAVSLASEIRTNDRPPDNLVTYHLLRNIIFLIIFMPLLLISLSLIFCTD